MATQNQLLSLSFPASADLSSDRYKVCKLNSSGEVVLVTAITDIPLGILQNKPDAQGKPAHILPISAGGVSKIALGATLAKGVLAGTSAAGLAVADATTNYTLGIITVSGENGDVGSILLGSMTAKA